MSKMKVVVIAAVAAIAAGGYWFSQQQPGAGSSAGGAKSSLLSRVPSDTVLFFGGLETIPYVNPYSPEMMKDFQSSVSEQIGEMEALGIGTQGPALSMLSSLTMDFSAHFFSNQVTEMNDFAVYTLGIYPVVAWTTDDIASFTDTLNRIEKEKKITSRSFTLGEANIREYLIDEKSPVKMYIAINGNTVSLAAVSDNQEILKLFAGVNLPEQNMANTNKLKELKSEHKLLPFGLGFVDINRVIKSLSSEQNNRLKQTLTEVSEGKSLAEITSNICFNDAAKIIAKWPRMVFGYRHFDIDSNPIITEGTLIFEHSDSQFLSSLMGVIGTIPEYSMDEDVLSFGIGLNVDTVASFVSNLHKNIVAENYQCPNLVEMQQQIKQNNPAMLAMGAQMAAGVQGISIHLTKFDMAAATAGEVKGLEGMAVITAKNPQNLLLAASSFYPALAQLDLTVNGGAKTLELPMNMKADISISDNAISLQFGQSDSVSRRITDIHQGKGLSPSLLRSGMDFSAYFKTLEPMLSGALAQAPNNDPEKMKKMVKNFENLGMKFVYDINVNDQGIVFDIKVAFNNASK